MVSLLVPTFNSAPFVGECIKSVLGQTFENLEILVIDDCSTDGTYEAVQQVVDGDPRVTVLRNEHNLGNRGNFERCLAAATAPLVKFVCGDDVLAPEAVDRMVRLIADRPDMALVTSHRRRIDELGNALPDVSGPISLGADDSVVDGFAAGNLLLSRCFNWIGEPTTVLFRRDLLPVGDLYHLGSAAPARNLDVVWWLKIAAGYRIGVITDTLSAFRIHAGQQSQQSSIMPDLVLSWYDIILGATEIGYLADPNDESQALAAFVANVQQHLPLLPRSAHPRIASTLAKVDARLRQLVAA